MSGLRWLAPSGRLRRCFVVLMVPALLLAAAAPALAAISPTPDHPTLGTTSWGTDGRVWAMVRIGDIIYLGGNFTQAVRGDGGATAPRSDLMAVNVVTGYLKPWHPAVDGIVFSMATDGTTIFVGGDFTSVNGLPRENFAAIGSRGSVRSWHLNTTNQVRALTYSGTTLFIGGQFGFVEGQRRTRLAAADLSVPPPAGGTPALLDWTPSTNKSVRTILVLPDGNILIGGVWTQIRAQGSMTWDTTKPFIQALTPPGPGGGLFAQWDTHPIDLIWKLALTPNGSVIAGRGGNQGGSLTLYNGVGDVIWNRHANGDVQSVGFEDGEIVAGGHWSDIQGGPSGVIHLPKLIAVDSATGKIDTSWEPWPNSTKGVWSILTGTDKLLVGGDFTTMDHGAVPVPHFAQFSITP
jgi:hypothetical protein